MTMKSLVERLTAEARLFEIRTNLGGADAYEEFKILVQEDVPHGPGIYSLSFREIAQEFIDALEPFELEQVFAETPAGRRREGSALPAVAVMRERALDELMTGLRHEFAGSGLCIHRSGSSTACLDSGTS